MSLLNPFSGLQHLHLVPRFLQELRDDLTVLFAKDLSLIGKLPKRGQFGDDASHVAAVATVARLHRFAFVRQTVRKQYIRESLWTRFGICYGLLGPLVVLFWSGVIIFHIACAMQSPRAANLLTQGRDFLPMLLGLGAFCLWLTRSRKPAKTVSQFRALLEPCTSLLRDRRGRAILPPVEALDGNRGIYYFSDADLDAICREAKRRRRWWRLGHYALLILIAGFLAWTFLVVPSLAYQR